MRAADASGYDLKLDLDGPVRTALNEAIESIKPLLAGTLGDDAEVRPSHIRDVPSHSVTHRHTPSHIVNYRYLSSPTVTYRYL